MGIWLHFKNIFAKFHSIHFHLPFGWVGTFIAVWLEKYKTFRNLCLYICNCCESTQVVFPFSYPIVRPPHKIFCTAYTIRLSVKDDLCLAGHEIKFNKNIFSVNNAQIVRIHSHSHLWRFSAHTAARRLSQLHSYNDYVDSIIIIIMSRFAIGWIERNSV